MDIINIPALLAEGKLTDISEFDTTKAYIPIGIYKSSSLPKPQYPIYAIKVSDLIASSGISGSGTLNYLPKFTPNGTTLGDSQVYDNGTGVGIGTTAPDNLFHVEDLIRFGDNLANNTRIGYQAGYSLVPNVGATTGVRNVYLGNGAGYSNVSGIQNVAIGWQSGNSCTADQNTSVGCHSMRANVSGIQNVCIGNNAHENGITGNANIAIGVRALVDNTSDANIAIGLQAMEGNTTGSANVAIGGGGVFAANTIGTDVVALGYQAIRFGTAYETVSVGSRSLYNNNNKVRNTAVGMYTGYTNPGSYNVFLGFAAGFYETGDSKIMVDNQIRASEADARTKSILYGVMDGSVANQFLNVNGRLGTRAGTSTKVAEVGGVLFDHYDDVSISGVFDTDLYSDTIPANTLTVNGDKLLAEYTVVSGGDLETKILFGGTTIFAGILDIVNATGRINVTIIRVDATTVRCTTLISMDNGSAVLTDVQYISITKTLSNSQILKLVGNSPSATPGTAKMGFVEFLPAAV